MCIICDDPNIQNIEQLDCAFCEDLVKIPFIDGLKELCCFSCPNLEEIPYIPSITHLYCHDCPKISTIPHLDKIETMFIYSNSNINEIPVIKSLRRLYCSNIGIEKLEKFKNIERLYCISCPLLKYIPEMPGLEELYCLNCPLLVQTPLYVPFINCTECPWSKHDENYCENMNKLMIIEKWFEGILTSKKILNILKEITPIYWDPEMKGGFFYKKKIEKELTLMIHNF